MRTITITGKDYSKLYGLLAINETSAPEIVQSVKDIISSVRQYGDVALLDYTNKFDRNKLTIDQLKARDNEIEEAYLWFSPDLKKALELSAERIQSYYEKLKPQDLNYVDDLGVTLGARHVPVNAAGIYVPGGKASYPSSVLMNAMPAKVAGVQQIVMVCPAPNGEVNPVVLAAAKICGITEIYKIGGAQAVAALAYGTQTVPRVDKIVGPGNAYVAEAKRQVFGQVGIDMIAGPSEILVIADENNDPNWIAADLLSQAEHDESARSILVTTSQNFAQQVIAAIYETMQKLDRKNIAREAIENNSIAVVVDNLEVAAEISNFIAPEHLELAIENPENLVPQLTNAGAIFLGRYTPEAIGDYIAGPSHVLPTVTGARFSSGLSVTDFLKRQSIIGCSETSFAQLAEPTLLMARSEGLSAHALSVELRTKKS